jgi:hypothetical protein
MPPTMSRYRALDHTVSPCHGHRVAPLQGHQGIGRGRPQGGGAAAGICGRGMACEECVGPFLSHTASVWNITITFQLRHYLKVRIVVFCTPATGTHHALRFEMIWLSQSERCSAPSASTPEEDSYGCHQTQCWPTRLAILASTESACWAFGMYFAPCPA